MPSQQRGVIEIMSDEESPTYVHGIRKPSVSSTSPTPIMNNSVGNASSSIRSSASCLPRSRALAGRTFAFRGTWLTMTTEAAEDLCKANGGEVSLAITPRTQYVVLGGKGTNQNANKFTAHGATLITEADFLGMILSHCNANKENNSASASHKRQLEESASGPCKPTKAHKSEPAPEEADMKWLHFFLSDGEIQMKGKTLAAYDCGGEVFRAQRGKRRVQSIC